MKLSRLLILTIFLLYRFTVCAWSSDQYVKVTATAIGEGMVYATITNPSTLPDYAAPTYSTNAVGLDPGMTSQANGVAYIYAKPNDNFVFDKWTSGSWSSYQKNASVPITGSSSNTSSSDPKVYTFTATFKAKGLVTVSSSDETRGVAILSGTNAVNNTIKLSAIENVFKGKFAHWLGPNGDIVSYDANYSFIISSDNIGNYTAVFDSRNVVEGFYVMLYNEKSSKYLGLLGNNDNTASNQRFFPNSILLADPNFAYSSPAFVLKMTGTPDDYFNLTDIDFSAQGTSIKANPSASAGKLDFLRVKDGSYQIRGKFYGNTGFMKYETSSSNGISTTIEEHYGQIYHPGAFNGAGWTGTEYFWKIVVLTEDEHTHCFGAEPKSGVSFQGKYYTTMFTSFPYKCLDGVNAFIVDRINDNGTIHLKRISQGIVPKETPVILQCNTTNPKTNRLLPILDNVSIQIGTNYLKGEIWIKDYTKQESSYRTSFNASQMRVFSNDECAFKNVNNQDILATTGEVGTLTYIQNNTCYLNLSSITNSNKKDSYSFEVPEKPLIQPVSQSYMQGQSVDVTISCSTQGATIKYSTDEENWFDYQSGSQIAVLQNTTIFAKAVDPENDLESEVSSATYTFTALAAPTITPTSAEAEVGETLTFTATNPNGGSSTMQYRIDGGEWMATTGTITVTSAEPKNGTVKVKVVNGSAESEVATATYTFTQPAPTYQPITLAELVTKPVDDTKYEITDLTAVAFVDNDQLLVCKDNNAYANRDEIQTGWYDYINTSSGFNFSNVTTGDQSNWIALRLTSSKGAELLLKKLTNVKGMLVNNVNPEFQLDDDLTYSTSDEVALNTYVAASFSGENHQQGNNGRTYFFVQPKPMEYAQIDWAQWDGEKFIAPVHDADHQNWNQVELVGQFGFNGSYLENPSEMNDLVQNHVYMMTGVIKLDEVPRRAAAASASKYVVFPTNLKKTTKDEGGIITGVNNVAGVSDVAGVEYVNLAGQRSSRPWSGVNIIVTRYTDGSFTTSRIILN